jgi:glycosyltransferase involved in cell wall biosynthesis
MLSKKAVGLAQMYADIDQERARLGVWGQDNSAPRYSVCVCNYNMADTLERAMRSVLDQLDRSLYEVVVIDDGSNDGSLNELEKLAQKYPNFRYFSLPRDRKRKLGLTRNVSIRAARGEYVLLHIDADDEWKPYLQDFVVLYHKIEEAAGRDIHLSGQQTGIGKRDLLLKYGPFENIYRCEDRNLMMKLAKEKLLLFLDYRVYRTRMARPLKKKIIKAVWDDCSHMIYDLRQNEPKWSFIKQSLLTPFGGKNYSLISKFTYPVLIIPMYILTRFMPPIINHISRKEMREYHEKHRGIYAEVMERLGGDPDLSFLSEEARDIYSHKINTIGFRSE